MLRLSITMLSLAFSLSVLAVPFTLHNGTAKSIPLQIPSVMNPNLSPFSDSAVDLKVGQKIYFDYNKKRYLLLEVSEELRDQVLEVGDLIKVRKAEIDGLQEKKKR